MAAELTELGMACEHLVDTPAIRSGAWVIFAEHAPDAIFSGGDVASHPIIVLLANAIQGASTILPGSRSSRKARRSSAIGEENVPAYVAVQEIPEINWGMYGKQVDLSAMRAPATA